MKFDQKYNHDTFSSFVRGFLPEDYVEKEKDIADLSRCKIITKARELGHSPSLNVYVLEMNHAKETDPRVSIATDAFKLLATFGYDKALVIFRNDDSQNYRFSYLTVSLDLNEKNKVVAKYSNARRYSFFLGEGAKTKTPEQQLVGRGRVIDTNDLLSRFSLEVVNKQFYFEVAKYFDELVSNEDNNLALPSVSQENINVRKSFAVRLIGRLMFCWFLKQKKSDFGQLIPNELLSSSVVSENYYHSILEPLFFEVLNASIDTRGIRNELFDKVPYLNGGLFNPQYDDYYDLDRGTFTSRHINTLRVSDTWFREFFMLLETYNFTIDENTVFDQELSVDPEMLGRIFENLLAEINPETGSSERKRTGSFYTPRQIVEYMVDQSLIEYLKTKTSLDEKKLLALVSYDLTDDAEHPLEDNEKQKVINAIESLKLLDPACGSGAFPIGALQKIVYILQQIDPDCKLWLEQKLKDVPELYKQKIINEVKTNPFDYTRKLDVIKNSIFGVDIQPIAVDVSRLRCFLTLVVESEIDDTKPNRGIEPLPNLDFKFVCANTLIGLPKRQSGNLFEDHSGITELSGIMSEYFSCNSHRKNEIRLRFSNTQKEILNRTLSAFGQNVGELTQKLTLWDPFSNKSNSWFDPEWMFGAEEKFDIVIGNPPYVRPHKIPREDKLLLWKYYRPVFEAKSDLYACFIQKSVELLRPKGVLSFIVSKTWLSLESFTALRDYILDNTKVLLLSIPPKRTFKTATVETVIAVLQREADEPSRQDNEITVALFNGKEFICDKTIKQSLFQKTHLHSFDLSLDNFTIVLNKKIKTQTKPLIECVEFSYGIKSGDDKKYISTTETTPQHKKLLRRSDFGKYSTSWRGEYVWYVPDHMRTNRKTARPGTPERFESEKIMIQDIGKNIVATLDIEKYYVKDALLLNFKQNGMDLRYILGLLNSHLLNYFYRNTFANLSVSKNAILALPIHIINLANSKEVESEHEILKLVDQILNLKKQDIDTDITSLESQIDQIVYNLYGLTPEEIEVVEG